MTHTTSNYMYQGTIIRTHNNCNDKHRIVIWQMNSKTRISSYLHAHTTENVPNKGNRYTYVASKVITGRYLTI